MNLNAILEYMNAEDFGICHLSADANEDLGVPMPYPPHPEESRRCEIDASSSRPLGELGDRTSTHSAELTATDKVLVSGGCCVKILELLCVTVTFLCQ